MTQPGAALGHTPLAEGTAGTVVNLPVLWLGRRFAHLIPMIPAVAIPWDPDLFEIGAFRFTWHSLFAVLGILAGVWIARRLGRRTTISDDQVTTLALWGVGGGIAVARFLFVIDNLDVFSSDWGRILALNDGGITVWGAPLGGAMAVALAAWWMKLDVPTAVDIGAPGLILGMAIGRIGDLINGEHHALATELPWAVYYTHANAIGQTTPVHPATTYELLGDLAIFALAMWLASRYIGRLYLFWTALAGYGALRLGLQFLRIDQPEHLWGLQQSQLIGVLALLAFAMWVVNRVRMHRAART